MGQFPRVDRAVAALIVAVIVGLAGIGLLQHSGASFIPMLEDKDQISEQQARDRARTFNASTPLEVRFVAAGEIPQALATMRLSDDDKASLLRELGIAGSTSVHAAAPASGVTSASANPSPAPTARTAAARPSLRLAWITLWDTDAQDGDIVRIDSSGFSTEVPLMNTPVTFAVPVPGEGVVNVTGVYDGGGGITVGALSGVHRVALPIMSVGQVLGVPVVGR